MQPKLERQLTSNFDEFATYDDEDIEEADEEKPKSGMKDAGSPGLPPPRREVGKSPFRFLTGEATDIGGGHENQDKGMLFRCGQDDRVLVMGVFDGHGRELGELAALVARDFMREEIQKPEVIEAIEESPTTTLEKLFLDAHNQIKLRFMDQFKKTNWQVTETDEGYLIKEMKQGGRITTVTNVHGGTTATVVIIFGGRRIIVANVGDSTALFGGRDKDGNIIVKELSGEHSPESEEEFVRVRDTQPSAEDSRYPKLRFVYDMFDKYQTPKHQCPKIFEVGQTSSTIKKTGTGYYFKNVRNEWATLVTTPPGARFQDALAFTRSLGDLHLHVYGVSHVPEVNEYDLSELHGSDDKQCSVMFVCTDGVWDNWKFEDIVEKTLEDSLIQKTLEGNDAQQLADKMMMENLKLAKHHFGSQADNMTGILCLVNPESY
mmetsp:Transcript_1369/g.1512  ORF Transcript_1369/g.1512 Transcript_1369/m.1512 type:complete len:433 (+) Transcript_1369:504-1802(+)